VPTLPLSGVFAAAVTPLTPDLSPDLEALPPLLEFLADRGCHGALVLGTTGEGPSFTVAEEILQARSPGACPAAGSVTRPWPATRPSNAMSGSCACSRPAASTPIGSPGTKWRRVSSRSCAWM
jgi:hypothetical protein